jgi:hypothetical protein
MCSANLLRTCHPRKDEPILSLLLRLSEVNRYKSPSWIVEHIQGCYLSPKAIMQGALDLKKLSELSYIPEDDLQNLVYWPVPEHDGLKNLFLGGTLPRYLLSDAARVCPECLQEAPYARKIWDFALYTACPTHKMHLVSSCPSCGESLSWSRKSVPLCSCGYDLRLSPSECRAASDFAVSRHLLSLAEGKYLDEPSVLSGLNLESFSTLVTFFAGQIAGFTDSTGKRLISLPEAQRHPLLESAYRLFHQWPNTFFDFLEQHRGALFYEKFYRSGLQKDFGTLYSGLYEVFAGSQYDFLREAFEYYIRSIWDNGYITDKCRFISRESKAGKRFSSQTAATKALGFAVKRVSALAETGFLKGVVKPLGPNYRLFLIDDDSLASFKAAYADSLTLEQVSGMLKIDRHQVVDFLRNNLLDPFLGPTVDGSLVWRIQRTSVDVLLNKIRLSIRPCEQTENPIPFHKAIQKLSLISVDASTLIKLVLNGTIHPVKEVRGFGLEGFLFSEVSLQEYLLQMIEKSKNGRLSLEEAAAYLKVKQEVLLFWIKKGLIPCSRDGNISKKWWSISPLELENFKESYAISAPIARNLGTSPSNFIKLCQNSGINPVSGPDCDGGRQYLFKRADLESIVSTASAGWPVHSADDKSKAG